MADDLVFYTNPQSRGRIARWMLEEVGQPYRTEVLDYGTTMKAREFLSLNPMGKVPTIVHRGTVVTEAAAICLYLADAFPQTKLAPAAADRANYYRWTFFAAAPLEQAATNKALGFRPTPEQERMAGYGNYDHVMDALNGWFSAHDYAAGTAFTAADVYVGSGLAWGMMFGTVEKRPAFERYVGRLGQRPAFQRAHKLDDELAAEHPVAPQS